MQRIQLLLCTCFIIASSATIWAQESGIGPGIYWRIYTVEDQEFSVNLPFWPTMMTSNGLRKGDGQRRLQRLLKTSYDRVTYSIETFENPEPRQSLEQFVDEQGLGSDYDPRTKES